ncbi:kelch repeat-containing protein 1-like [Papaver somniferum]|uniref:kelch repeat-containing protein 1-like n=1 Tax=Papaver somniferum TaxID=3469 RepID=UPI000E704DD6|nr:kelch repeat-containing protein 1-like [Papaver somniferum]
MGAVNNYYVAVMKSNVTKWAVRIRRVDEGSSVSGKAEDGSENSLPEDFPLYQPWEFKLLENEEKKVAVNPLNDKNLGKGKSVPKKPTSKFVSKITTLKDDVSRKRARYDSSSSSKSSDEDTFVSEEEVSIDLYQKKLSDLFSGDGFATLEDDEMDRAFKMVSKICTASNWEDRSLRGAASWINPDFQFAMNGLNARISYAISLDNERNLRKLQDENAKLRHEKSNLSDVSANLTSENTKLRNENLTNSQNPRNKQGTHWYVTYIFSLLFFYAIIRTSYLVIFADLYDLSDEAANLPDAEILLEHLNSSLNNYPTQGFENLSLEELKLKYTTLRKCHRSALSSANSFKRRFYEKREAIQVLEAKKNTLIIEKDEIALKGAKALEHFQESIIEFKIERDLAFRERDMLIEERNLIRSQLLIEKKEKEYQKRIVELETGLNAKEEESSACNSKYQQLKVNWFNLVQNNSNDANRSREAAVKRVCLENEDSEEDSKEEASNSETERNEEDEN